MTNGISVRTDNGTILATVEGSGASSESTKHIPFRSASMNTVRDLKLLPVWVNPLHLAKTALHVMQGHKIKALGVVDGSRLAGVVELEDIVLAPEGTRVEEVMHLPAYIIDASSSVRDVAQVFIREGIDAAPVLDQQQFRGMLTPAMLLQELGQSFDPLTSLPWSDKLREWGAEHFKNNEEVTIIFIDLNQFGLYNKKYGHIIGDRVIAKVASFIASEIDTELDVLVRYGGDEFAIGTLRDGSESNAFAELLAKRFDGRMEGADEPVSFSTGVFGGRRHKERDKIHYAATIDNLINMASKNCLANKKRDRGEFAPEKPSITYRVLGIYADEDDHNGIITVILSGGGNVYSGADAKGGKTVVEAIASATARAIERAEPEVHLEVSAIDLLQDEDVQIVSVTGVERSSRGERAVSAAKRVVGELASAVVEATIDAFK